MLSIAAPIVSVYFNRVADSRAMGNNVELMELPGVGHDANAPLFPGAPDPHGSKSRVVDFFHTHLRGHLRDK